jgi:N,N'-diacetyllegionaminate synthase
MTQSVSINGCPIGPEFPVYMIAEIGGNFREISAAVRMIDLAKKAGVDAVKLQHYQADTVASKRAMFDMPNTGVVSQYDLFKKYEIGDELTGEILAYCRKVQMTVFSTPSHPNDVDRLAKYDLPAYKIGSDDLTNIPLLRYVAKQGKPLLLSTGMSTMAEVQQAVDALLKEGNDQVILLHCVTNYPAAPESVNLRAMLSMQAQFPMPVGYSDHTLGIDACYAAAVLGASVLEFHFTYDKKAEGPDHMISKDYEDLAALVSKVRQLPALLGDGIKRPADSETGTRRNNRKSLVLLRDVKAGDTLAPDNMGIKRPGYGISAAHYDDVLGKKVRRDIPADEVLQWDDLQ